MSIRQRCLISLLLAAIITGPAIASTSTGLSGTPDPKLVKQKETLLNNLVKRTKSSERYSVPGNQKARDLIAEAEELAAIAREKLEVGDLEVAIQGLDEAFKRVFAATRMCRTETGSTFAEQVRYQDLQEGIDSLISGWDGSIDPKTEELIVDSRRLAEENNYRAAVEMLSQGYETVASAVALSRDGEIVVYSLDFALPKDEYDYEVRRYSGNRIIIELLLEKHPGSTGALVESYVANAEALKESAEEKAGNGEFQAAVQDMEAAGKHQKRALSLLGIRL